MFALDFEEMDAAEARRRVVDMLETIADQCRGAGTLCERFPEILDGVPAAPDFEALAIASEDAADAFRTAGGGEALYSRPYALFGVDPAGNGPAEG